MRKEHPRPQFIRDTWLNLNGQWTCDYSKNIKGFKKVTIFGSTGLIGKLLLDNLINDKDFKLINIVSRKELPLKGNRVNQIIIKKLNSDIIKSSVRGSDIVFSSIGTTQSKVKYNKEEYRKIDHDITLRIAESCKKYDVKNDMFLKKLTHQIDKNHRHMLNYF